MTKFMTLGLFLGLCFGSFASQSTIDAILNADVNTKAGRAVVLNTPLENNDLVLAETFNKKFDALRKEISDAAQIGDIKASMLTEGEFQSNYGTDWVLAKGQDVSTSKYKTLTGRNSLPDLRGMFLRGKNNSRADGRQNPVGEYNLGDYQADDNKSHTHTYWVPERGATGGPSMDYKYSTGLIFGATTAASGGAEARPRNITVNYFIKIN